jgi:hypothetical protein
MAEDTDKLPPVTETFWVVYRVDTGVIVATETIWTEEGVPADEPGSIPPSVRSMMSDRAEVGLVDVLQVSELPAGILRVDLSSRTVVAGEQPVAKGLLLSPGLLRP